MKQSRFKFSFIVLFVCCTLVVSKVKRISQLDAMVKVLIFGMKTMLILYPGIVALAFIWVILHSIYNAIKGIKTRNFQKRKRTFKGTLQTGLFIPVFVLWVVRPRP